MSIVDVISKLEDWEGYEVAGVEERAGRTGREVWIELCPRAGRVLRCASCGQRAEREHERRVRDLPVFDASTVVIEPTRRRVLWVGGSRAREDVRPFFERLGPEGCGRLKAMMTVYVLRDDLKHLWDYRHRGYARRFWRRWYERALESGIEPLVRFANCLRPYLEGVLAHCRWPVHTGLIEGINNRIKVKRMACGFRDEAYFFLKIRAALPGDPR